jgi:hypothetical protein
MLCVGVKRKQTSSLLSHIHQRGTDRFLRLSENGILKASCVTDLVRVNLVWKYKAVKRGVEMRDNGKGNL